MHVMHNKDIYTYCHYHFHFSPSNFSPSPKNTAYRGMDSLSPLNSFHHNMSSIDNNTYMAPDLSHGLNDTLSSISISSSTLLNTSLLSPGDFSHSSGSFSSSLGGSFYESGTYTSNPLDR